MSFISRLSQFEEENFNYNLINIVKRIDLFRQPIRIRTERSTKGRAYEEESGSFLGVAITVFIIFGLVNYSAEVFVVAQKGLLDNFSSQTVVNKFEEDSNDLRLFDFNFLPSMNIKTLSSTDEEFDEFKAHPSSEVYNFDNEDPTLSNFNYDKLDRYIKFYVKTRVRIKGVETHYRSKMIPCDLKQFKDNNFDPDEITKQKLIQRVCPDLEFMQDYWRIKNSYTNYDERHSFNIAVVVCNNETAGSEGCATKDDIDFLLERLYFTFYVVEDNVQFSEVGENPYFTIDKFHS